MVHPVPDDVCMEIGNPGLRVVWIYVVSFVPMDVDLDGSYTPPLMNLLSVSHQVIHCGGGLNADNTLTEGTAAVAFLLPAFLVGNFDYPFLHTPTCFLLYHHLDFFVDILKGLALHVRCDIYIVIMRQFQTYINGTRVERRDVLWITPVMALTLFDIAWLDMVAC
jgi:hypothetical protein